jgi:hypothetical protein
MMQDTLERIFLGIVEALRRLWQRLTRQTPRPVPVPVRARYTAQFSSPDLHDFRPRTHGFGRDER